jgi:carboxypeptidase T
MANYHRNVIAGQVTVGGVPTTFRSLKDDFTALQKKAPGIAELTAIRSSEQGEDIHAFRVGKDPSMPVLLCGCHHAREWISVEIPFLFAEFLVNTYSSDKKVQRIVDSTEIWFVPLVNPDGHENSVLKNRLWRKTFPTKPGRVPVDPNRNYNTTTWNLKVGEFSDTPALDDYRGPKPEYAAEVVAMQKFVRDKKFKGAISYHSHGQFVMFPWAGKAVPPASPKLDQVATTLQTVINSKGTSYDKLQSNGLYPMLRGETPEEGLIPGDFIDFVLETLPDCITLTIELDPPIDDPRGFVLPESEIEPVFDKHRAAMLTYLNCMTTINAKPVAKPQNLQKPGIPSPVVVFQPECEKPFLTY